MIQDWAAADPGAPALFTPQLELTAAALAERVRAARRWLRTRTPKDQPVALVGHPTPEVVCLLYGALEEGRGVLPIHPRWTQAEIDHLLAELPPVTFVPAPPAIELGVSEAPLPSSAEPAATAWFGTSGTSGAPKAVELPLDAFLASARAFFARIPKAPGDRLYLGLPLGHVGGFSVLIRAAVGQIPLVLGRPFHPADFLTDLAKGEATVVSMVPTMLERVLPATPPPKLRVVLLGGAPASAALLERARGLGWPVVTTYGLTEAAAMVTLQALGETGADVGLPLPGNQLRIEAGRIWVKGPTLLRRYVGRSAPPSPLRDGWLDTGDYGALDAAGRLRVDGRGSELIIRGGENVFPAEVEAVLKAAPEVKGACVVGLADPLYGQRVAAALVVGPGFRGAELAAFVGPRLAHFKHPTHVAVVPSLPELAVGKIDRAAVGRIPPEHFVPVEEAVSPPPAFD